MLEKSNAYFDEMYRVSEKHSNVVKAHNAKKESIYEQFGYDSKEVREWFYEKKRLEKYPYPSGAYKAYHAFNYSIRVGNDELEMSDFVWENEASDFIDTLRKAGIRTFVVTNRSTELMENMHWFVENGCTLIGLTKIIRTESHSFYDEDEVEVLGVRFKID